MHYEITSYLGNVNVVITDRKIPAIDGLSVFEAVSISIADYYAYGMEMKSRTWTHECYRFGYNGMEKDDEAKDNGNSYTTEFRQYDPRLGRWLSLDPKMAEFPQWSPYVAFNDNPVMYTDPEGLSAVSAVVGAVKEVVGKLKGVLNKLGDPIKTQVLGEVTVVVKRTFWQKLKGSARIAFRNFVNVLEKGDKFVNSLMGNARQSSGTVIYGTNNSSKDSPATKIKPGGKIWDTFDFGELNELLGKAMVGMSTKAENTLGGDFEGTKFAELSDHAKEISEYEPEKKKEKENTKVTTNQDIKLRIMETNNGNSQEIESKGYPNIKQLKDEYPKAFKIDNQWWVNTIK
jgi:RHS repeat-associated protein